jgi:transcriptional regulator
MTAFPVFMQMKRPPAGVAMYIPAHFDASDTDIVHQLIAKNPFGSLITHGENGLDANHIPFELAPYEGELGVLHAHVARANPLWTEVADGDQVLVVFHAGDAYISPSWYPSKHETHMQVPTWNYIVVHAHGRITVRDDEKYVRGVLARLTRAREATQTQPWKMSDAPKEFTDDLLTKIVGLQVEITSILCKKKLGQHKEAGDIQGPALALHANHSHPIADAMLAEAAKKTNTI